MRFLSCAMVMNALKGIKTKRKCNSWVLLAWVNSALFLAVPAARAADPEPPTTKLLEAQLISPADAASYYGYSTQHTVGLLTLAGDEPEIDVLAQSLVAGRDISVGSQRAEIIQSIFSYVRNNINTEIRYGLGKGGRGAWIDQSGTPFDQAELMVKLLRKAGIQSTFTIGDLQLSASQFGKWTGLVKQLNSSTQTFSVNARQACRLLADGGIPAVINGQSGVSNCDSFSGDLTSLTIGHIWVVVGSERFDPSFKEYSLKSGIDRPAAMNCGSAAASTCGALVKTAVTGAASTGVENGVPFIQGYSVDAGVSQVGAFASNLANAIKSADRTVSTLDVVGGKDLQPQSIGNIGVYTDRINISGDIPDQYRTLYSTFSQIYNSSQSASHSFFADEIAGRRVANAPTMRIDDVQPTSSTYLAAPTRRTFPSISCTIGCVTVTVDHPYVSSSGNYADEQKTFKLVEDPTYEAGFFRQFNTITGAVGSINQDAYDKDFPEKSNMGALPLLFVHGFGQATSSAIRYASDKNNVAPFYPQTDCPTGSSTGVIFFLCSNASQVTTVASIVPYRTLMDKIVDGVVGTVTTRHHDIGVAYSSHTPEITRLTLQESMSVAAKNDSDADRRIGFNIQAITLSEVEGMVSPLEDGAQFSFASMFFNNKALPNRPIVGGNQTSKVYMVSPANMAAFLASQPDAYPVPVTKGKYPAGWTCGQSCWRKTQLQAIADQGYSTIIMAGGQSELFFNGGSSSQYEKAYTIWEYMKGGAAVSDPFKNALKTTEVLDAGSKARKQLSVSPVTGMLAYQAEPDIVTGEGQFPFSLPFVRTFNTTFHDRIQTLGTKTEPRGCGQGCNGLLTSLSHKYLPGGVDGQFHERLGGGWDHNYNISATMTNNPVRNLGEEYALDAVGTIARVQVLRDLADKTDASADLATHVSTFAATIYMGYSIDAVVKVGNSTEAFHMINDGLYSSANPNASLTYTTYTNSVGAYVFAPVTYTSANGDVIQFGKSAGTVEIDPSQGTTTLKDYSRTWLPTTWSFPNGVVVSFEYSLQGYNNDDATLPCAFSWGWSCSFYNLPGGYRLTKVSNNLGRSLSFGVNGGNGSYVNATVTDESGRVASFNVSGCDRIRTDNSANRFYYFSTTCETFTATNPNGITTTYKYSSPLSASGQRNNYRLEKIFTSANAVTPFQQVSYDEFGRVLKVTDRNGVDIKYFPSGITGAELWKPSVTVAPGGERSFEIYNSKGSNIYSRSTMGRETIRYYDNANRLVKEVLPEGNGSQIFYDARGNVVQNRSFSKLCGAVASSCADDIISLTDYVGDEASIRCVNSVTCNKPLTETDPKGNVSNYTWDSATGALRQITLPADKFGDRPQVDLNYSNIGGINFLTSKIEKVTSSKSVVTTYSYNAGNHFVLENVTQDPGGLNISSNLSFDTIGNLVSVDGPLPGSSDVTTYRYDAGRRIEWIVYPDPDGAGPLRRKAVKYTYDGDDLLLRTDVGTAASSDGIGFEVTTSERNVYDAMGNRTEVKVVKP